MVKLAADWKLEIRHSLLVASISPKSHVETNLLRRSHVVEASSGLSGH